MFINFALINVEQEIQSPLQQMIKIGMYSAFLISFLLSLPNIIELSLPKIIKVHIAVIISISILFVILYGMGWEVDFSEISLLLLPLLFVLFSYSLKLNEKQVFSFLLFFCIATLLMSLYKVIFNLGGFVILEQYTFGSKNQISPTLSSSITILLYLLLNKYHKNKYLNIFLFLLFISIFLILFVSRGRSAILATLICCLFIIIFYSKQSFSKYVVIIFMIILFLSVGYSFIYDSLFLNRGGIDDLNSFSSGRTNVYILGLDYWLQNFWWGEIFSQAKLGHTPHNFILFRLVRFGILGGFLSIFLYLSYLLFIIKIYFNRKNVRNIYDLGFILMLIPYTISLLEYTFPFGPGTSQLINFFMFGQFLKNKITC
jgi:O-antigen ligase